MRSSVIALVALVSAFLGGTGALLVGKGAGWIDGETATIVRRETVEAGTPASRVETQPGDAAKPLPGNAFDPARIYRQRAAGVVTVISLFGDHAETGAGDTAQGSGFVVSRDGYILTNAHVITTAGEGDTSAKPVAASRVYVEFREGDRVTAEIVGWDLFDDVGVLKVNPEDHELRPVPLGDSSRVVAGEPVVAIGTPFGQTNTITAGIVAATERSVESLTSGYSLIDAIQTDAPINRGNSGGPLLDARGRAIGINAQIRSDTGVAEGVGFAVPINSAVRSMEQLIETGRVRYAWVGITTQTVTPSLARHFELPASHGAAIQSVIEDSPAEDAGLRAGDPGDEEEFAGRPFVPGGDVIVAIERETVRTAEDVVRAVMERLPGERLELTVLRGGERRTVEVVLAERPSAPPDASPEFDR